MLIRSLLCLACIITAALYWTALRGPYLLDDFSFVPMLEAWASGDRSWQETLLPARDSVLFSRPASMASLMLSTWLGGIGVFPLKLGNLIAHLSCGVLGWWLLRQCFRSDARLESRADALALVATAIWLLHPLQVSTVLYGVQRMAQMSTLFALAAASTYLIGRVQLQNGDRRFAAINLFITFPVLLLLGILSKQNAAVVPLLCVALELAYFRIQVRERHLLAIFYGSFVALPAVGVLALLVVAPERLLGGYAEYDFTVWQRLLTQPRVLLDYVGMWFVPRGPRMGLYTDAYAVSTGLLSPTTTLPAILTLVAISAFATAVRHRAPSVFAGWFFFLAAHAVESTILPLELHYEHRNYLPSFGLLLAAFGLTSLAHSRPNAHGQSILSRMTIPVCITVLGVLAFATLGRVLVWKDIETIVAQGARQHPGSLRVKTDALVVALRKEDYATALAMSRTLANSDVSRHRLTGRLNKVAIDCLMGQPIDARDLNAITHDSQSRLSVAEVQSIKMIVNVTGIRDCGDLSVERIADTYTFLLKAASAQPETSPPKYAVRSLTAQMYARAGDWRQAEHHAAIAWNDGRYLPAISLLIRAYIHLGKLDKAADCLTVLQRELRPFDIAGHKEAQALQDMIENRSKSAD